MAQACEHLEGLGLGDFPPPDPPEGCAECATEGTSWVALRECRECGHVGCCDSSPRRHATLHHQQTRHPVMRSVMPGDTWGWCYEHAQTAELAANG